MKKQTRGNIANNCPDEEEDPKVFDKEISKDQIMSLVNVLWTVIKIALILFVIFPFIDKIRHKDYFSRAVNFINEYDIGCKPCICSDILNRTSNRSDDDKYKTGF
jgi:hypothetical protein